MALILSAPLTLNAPPASAELLVHPVLHDGDNIAFMNQIVNAVNSVAEEFPEVRGITVTTEDIPNRYYAYVNSDGSGSMIINHYYASDPSEFTRLINQDVQLHYHPTLGHCSGPQQLAYHESAHVVDFARGKVADNLLVQRFGTGEQLRGILSGYSFDPQGSINPQEALAEAFAAVKCNGGNWAEQALYHMLVG